MSLINAFPGGKSGGSENSVIAIHTDNEDYYGETVHVNLGNGLRQYSGTIDNEGNVEVPVDFVGEYNVFVDSDTVRKVTIDSAPQICPVTLNPNTIYGFHLDATVSNPASCITYQVQYNGKNVDNYDYTPAKVDLSTGIMNPGSWNLTDDFFVPRSCMVKLNGKVDYYLNENDETKKEDGTNSDVTNTTYAGNAMMEWGRDGKKIWVKIIPDATPTNGATFYIADNQLDEDFHCWSFYDANGKQIDHFYTPKYNGAVVNNRLASLSGLTPLNNVDGQTEIDYANSNNTKGTTEWYTEVWADRQLIQFLLYMIGKSTNVQTVFGQGYTTGGSDASSLATTGTLNGKGQWYGSTVNNDKTKGVKVFGMEHFWGNMWRRTAGLIYFNNTVRYKLTWDKTDNSSQVGYDSGGSGYKAIPNSTLSGTSGSYANVAIFNEDGLYFKTSSGSGTTYFCDGLWFNNSQTDYAILGGDCRGGSLCGFAVRLDNVVSLADWSRGAALSLKPLAAKRN